MTILKFFLLGAFITTPINSLECHVRGQCSGVFAGFQLLDTYNECLEFCQSSENCEWFSHRSENEECTLFKTCNLDTSSNEYFSGQRGCSSFSGDHCYDMGFCLGNLVTNVQVDNINECRDVAEELEGKNSTIKWFSHYPSSGFCFITDSCNEIDTDCKECQYGSSKCERLESLVVIGGIGAPYQVELVGLNDSSVSKSLVNYPVALGSTAAFMGEKARVVACGGELPAPVTNQCYELKENNWNPIMQMTVPRAYAQSALIDQDTLWIIGGYDGMKWLSSTEMCFATTAECLKDVELPLAADHPGFAMIDYQTFALYDDGNLWLFEGGTWNPMPSSQEQRSEAQLGLATHGDESKILVVAGGNGQKSSEIFDLSTRAWRQGPDLPITGNLDRGSIVQVDNSFVIVGGYEYSKEDFHDHISSKNAQTNVIAFDETIEEWNILENSLQTARYLSTAVLVPKYGTYDFGLFLK